MDPPVEWAATTTRARPPSCSTRSCLPRPQGERHAAAVESSRPVRGSFDGPVCVSFLELFFDLVFVVVIAQLADRLAHHPTWAGAGWFVFLFYAVWASWINGTLYYDLHGTNDVSVRVFTFYRCSRSR